MSRNSRLVYSTETGRVKDTKPQTQITQNLDGTVRIHRETKGRKGNGVSLIKGLPLTGDELKSLAKKLKQTIGVGGSVKDGVIEIQTDQRERLKTSLESMGYTVKLAGS